MQLFKKTFLLAIFSSCILFSSLGLALSDNNNNSEAVKDASGKEIHQEVTHANIHNKQEADALPKSPAEYIFHKMDTNRDSSLSLSEFVSNFSMISDKKSLKNGKYSSSGSEQQGFWNGFSSSTMMIIATEIGDKTFFIAAVLSMRNSRLVVFAGAIGALICMTVLR